MQLHQLYEYPETTNALSQNPRTHVAILWTTYKSPQDYVSTRPRATLRSSACGNSSSKVGRQCFTPLAATISTISTRKSCATDSTRRTANRSRQHRMRIICATIKAYTFAGVIICICVCVISTRAFFWLVGVREQVISRSNVPEAMRFDNSGQADDKFYYRFRYVIVCLGLYMWVAWCCVARHIMLIALSAYPMLSPAKGWTFVMLNPYEVYSMHYKYAHEPILVASTHTEMIHVPKSRVYTHTEH